MTYTWERKTKWGYEVSSKGDHRFSAMAATMIDGRTLEQWYQCDVKGFDPGGTNWRLGKGQNPKDPNMTRDQLWKAYLDLWRQHFRIFPNKLVDLRETLEHLGMTVLTDMFAMTPINQAHAIATLLNEMKGDEERVVFIGIKNTHHQKEWLDPRCLYAGRGSALGNPIPAKGKDDRDRVCDGYDDWFETNKDTNEDLVLGLDYAASVARDGVLYLRCFCAPKRCHTETIKKNLLSRLVEEGYIPLDEDPSLKPLQQ